ncbi:sigma-70 family RNA polymerase sigma factor [Aquimarina sp. 2201CG5-10]|uniref:RNA polymerase sigma factor n=1 Tax=Aquimarina callyspongiae TaxID=3098150 RepID=UPI002AB48636|nr:sigma-70 family RNA polymerase sigma factor [Aquimarina sp. 2201CG5-10]MDY8138109.1 sigma-70 family RNA polymerase sigma factor [Aquimarina sp. 2201CG5-10]
MSFFSNNSQINALVTGDDSVIRLLYNTLFPKVLSFVKNNKGSKDDAQEIFNDAIYQLIVRAKVKGVQINTSFEAYFYTICKNLWYKELNKRKKEVRNEGILELKENDNHQETISAILEQERWELFEEMISKLSGNCAELLKDYFNKVPYNEIVDKFSYASENAAFQRVFKCKKRLMELIKKDARYKNLRE